MIDLHTHTTASDGSYPPEQLVREACSIGLEALAITDHDTLAGYDLAAPLARAEGLDLVCGIEMSCKYRGRSVHLLGYFVHGDPGDLFRDWILSLQESRHRRNAELIQRLQAAGFQVTIEEWYERAGGLPGRPHLARILQDKGYVASIQEAFDKYLAETGEHYTPRIEPDLGDAIRRIEEAGGSSVLPHPVRLSRERATIEQLVEGIRAFGLSGIEVIHSDHSPEDRALFESLAERFSLLTTGGSDFHGANKPNIALGSGAKGNVQVPLSMLDGLRSRRS